MKKMVQLSSLLFAIVSAQHVAALSLSSNDIQSGKMMGSQQEFNGFGCTGENLSPHLRWQNAPKGTKSFAITAYDPDAPTGSGWWHWQVVNIPVKVTELTTGAGSEKGNALPSASMQISNDYGSAAFGGACPPVGHGKHRYRFTVHALSVEKLDLTPQVSGALAGYMINSKTLETSTIEALYVRED